MDLATVTRAVDYLFPFLTPDCSISFYGGEPLLEFGTMARAIRHLEDLSAGRAVKPRYCLTTNGSLLDGEVLEFLAEKRFSVTLSFDGLAQDLQRKKGTFDLLLSDVQRLLAKPEISLEINSVFSAETVDLLSGSVRFLIELGVPRLDVNFAHKPPWTAASLLRLKQELRRVGEDFLSRYKSLKDIPWPGFYRESERGIHHCPAGLNQMALSAQGTLWGCAVFAHEPLKENRQAFHEKYCFGQIDSFIDSPQQAFTQKMAHYAELRMDRFAAPDRSCSACGEVEECWICPLAAASTTGEIGKIPDWSCQGARMRREKRRRFLERFERTHHCGNAESDD